MYVANFADRGFIESRDKDQLEYISKAIEKAIGVKSRISVMTRSNPDHGTLTVTSISFKKPISVADARSWLRKHGFKSDGLREESPNFHIFPLVMRNDFSEYRREYWDGDETILATYGIEQ